MRRKKVIIVPGGGSSGRRLPESCTLTMISGGRFQPEHTHKKWEIEFRRSGDSRADTREISLLTCIAHNSFVACSRLPDSLEREKTAFEKRVGPCVEARQGSL